ncbi:MAG: glycosyltransferase family 9 protein [Gemmataceae bacterium]
MRIGVLKPDHLGDLVLAAPALAALQRRFDDLVLLCSPHTTKLANHLFPGLALEPVLFPHLDKTRRLDLRARPLSKYRDRFDLLLCLRWDSYLKPHVKEAGISYYASGLDVLDLHVVVEHYQTISVLTGDYDPLFSYDYPHCPRPQSRPKKVDAVGLCISAGFPLNAWPLNHWLSLAELLSKNEIQVALLGGPCEKARLRILAGAVEDSLHYRPSILLGGDDFAGFLGQAGEEVDLIIATDSGTAHLLSLARPVISLFGGSPLQRFTPFGAYNAIISRLLPCSPCRQFDRKSINTCHTQECLVNLRPDQVLACLKAYMAGQDFHNTNNIRGAWVSQAPWDRQLAKAAAKLPPYAALSVI